jgi:hypothetical protein
MASRITIGAGYWLIMWSLLTGRLFAKAPRLAGAA